MIRESEVRHFISLIRKVNQEKPPRKLGRFHTSNGCHNEETVTNHKLVKNQLENSMQLEENGRPICRLSGPQFGLSQTSFDNKNIRKCKVYDVYQQSLKQKYLKKLIKKSNEAIPLDAELSSTITPTEHKMHLINFTVRPVRKKGNQNKILFATGLSNRKNLPDCNVNNDTKMHSLRTIVESNQRRNRRHTDKEQSKQKQKNNNKEIDRHKCITTKNESIFETYQDTSEQVMMQGQSCAQFQHKIMRMRVRLRKHEPQRQTETTGQKLWHPKRNRHKPHDSQLQGWCTIPQEENLSTLQID